MDPSMVDAGLGICVALSTAFGFQQLFQHASYQWHKLQKLDQSADETAVTEKVNPITIPGTQSVQSAQTQPAK